MKKIMLVLAVLFLAVPVYAADVNCDCTGTSDGSGLVTVTFNNTLTGDGNNVRAIALDITVDKGSINKGTVTAIDANYWVYPGSIDINDTTGLVDGNGTPLCDCNYPGTLCGSNSMSVEMASLYEKGVEPAPGQSGNILTFTVDSDCTVTLAANTIRGAVVLEDPNNPVGDVYGTCQVSGMKCYTGPNETRWLAVGSPTCWCWDKSKDPNAVPRQCRGDADDVNEGPNLNKPVLTNDLGVFLAAWNKKDTYTTTTTINVGGKNVLLICADYDHNAEGPNLNKGCLTLDLGIFLTNWNKKDTVVTPCP